MLAQSRKSHHLTHAGYAGNFLPLSLALHFSCSQARHPLRSPIVAHSEPVRTRQQSARLQSYGACICGTFSGWPLSVTNSRRRALPRAAQPRSSMIWIGRVTCPPLRAARRAQLPPVQRGVQLCASVSFGCSGHAGGSGHRLLPRIWFPCAAVHGGHVDLRRASPTVGYGHRFVASVAAGFHGAASALSAAGLQLLPLLFSARNRLPHHRAVRSGSLSGGYAFSPRRVVAADDRGDLLAREWLHRVRDDAKVSSHGETVPAGLISAAANDMTNVFRHPRHLPPATQRQQNFLNELDHSLFTNCGNFSLMAGKGKYATPSTRVGIQRVIEIRIADEHRNEHAVVRRLRSAQLVIGGPVGAAGLDFLLATCQGGARAGRFPNGQCGRPTCGPATCVTMMVQA